MSDIHHLAGALKKYNLPSKVCSPNVVFFVPRVNFPSFVSQMLFKIVAATSFLATFAAGYVIPTEGLSSRSLGVADDTVDLFVRSYTVPAGSYHPERMSSFSFV